METNNEQSRPLRLFKCEESDQYAQLVATLLDLQFCRDCLLRIEELARSNNSDKVTYEALWDAATIGFFRCFESPQGLNKDILKELPEGADEAYTFFKNYRDKHIAHRSNAMDQVKVGIMLTPENMPARQVEAVGYLAMQDASFADPEFIKSLKQLVHALGALIEKKAKTMSNTVLNRAKTESIDELYKLPVLRVVVPNSGYLKKTKDR